MSRYLIPAIVVFLVAMGVFGWQHSPRSRKLVVFGILVLLGLALVFFGFALIRRFILPLPPF